MLNLILDIREEIRLRVFENGKLREYLAGGCRRLLYEELITCVLLLV
jgi:hypothetical protein